MTGASRGIGAASAKEFAQKGAIVILAAQDEQNGACCARDWICCKSTCSEYC